MKNENITSKDLVLEALDQEKRAKRAQRLLFDEVAIRAKSDEAFRQRLSSTPEDAVREVYDSLPTEQRQLTKNKDEIIKNTAEKAQVLSRVLPGIDKDRVENLVFQTIEDTRRSFTLSLQLTQILFYAGLVIIAVTFITVLLVDTQELIALIFGGGTGVAAIVTSLLINPIDRVQNAAGNLVQIEIAFLSYYKQLSLLVTPTNATIDDTIKYVKEVGKTMEKSLILIEKYCEYRTKE